MLSPLIFSMATEQGSQLVPGPQKTPEGAASPESAAEGSTLARRRSKKEKKPPGSQKASSEKQSSGQGSEPSGSSKNPPKTRAGQDEPSSALPSQASHRQSHRHRPDSQQDAAQRTYGPLLNRIFGKVREYRGGGWRLTLLIFIPSDPTCPGLLPLVPQIGKGRTELKCGFLYPRPREPMQDKAGFGPAGIVSRRSLRELI